MAIISVFGSVRFDVSPPSLPPSLSSRFVACSWRLQALFSSPPPQSLFAAGAGLSSRTVGMSGGYGEGNKRKEPDYKKRDFYTQIQIQRKEGELARPYVRITGDGLVSLGGQRVPAGFVSSYACGARARRVDDGAATIARSSRVFTR